MKHPLFPSSLPIRSLAILACAAVSPASVQAASANATWVGAGADTNWSTSANWNSGGVTPFTLPSKDGQDVASGGYYNLVFYSNASTAINAVVDTISTGWYVRALTFNSVTGGHDITISGGDIYSSTGQGNIIANDNGSKTVTTIHIQSNIVSLNSLLSFQGTQYAPVEVTGNVTLTAATGTLQLRNGTGGNTTNSKISGVIGGANGGSVTLQSITGSDWTLANSNNRISSLLVGSGTLSSGANNALGSTPNLAFGQIGNTGIVNSYINLHGYNQTVSSLTVVTATAAGAVNYGHVINSNASTTSTFTYSNSTANETYGGTIDGNINFVKAGSNTFTVTGSNTYTGATSIQNGALSVSTVGTGAAVQGLGAGNTVNLGVAATSSGTLQYSGAAAGTLDKNIYALGNGLNTIQNNGSGLLTLSGSLVKNSTILVLNGGASGIKVTGTISGSAANSDLYITGGSTTLTAVNTYNGPTWVYGGGTLINGVNNALPTATTLILGGTDNSNGTFDLNGKNQTIAGLSGTGTGTQTVTNNGATTSTLTVTNGGTYGGVIANGAGTTALSVSGGDLVLGGINTYTGATTVTGGTLTVNGSLAAGSAVTVTGATLTGSGSANGTLSGNNATINGNGLNLGTSSFSGTSTLSGYNIASSVTVTNGTTSLTGTTKSTSALSVSQGATLNANGTIDGSAAISGLLKGSSTVTGTLTLTSGTLAPGTVHELTKVGGDFSMDASSKLVAEVSGAVAGTSYDQVQVGKNVSLAGTLDLTTLSGLTLGNKITLIDNTSSGTTTGYFATIITSDSTYTTASNSDYTFTVAGTEYLLSYTSSAENDGFNNDVTLTVVPEPGTWAMLVGGIGMLAFGQRLRSRRS